MRKAMKKERRKEDNDKKVVDKKYLLLFTCRKAPHTTPQYKQDNINKNENASQERKERKDEDINRRKKEK